MAQNYVGYLRYDTEKELELLKELYFNLELQVNFFQPVTKCREKVRVGSKVRKRYDIPRTSYQRVTESEEVSGERKKALKGIYQKLNPAELAQRITKLQNALYEQVLLKEKIRRSMGSLSLKREKSGDASLIFSFDFK